MPQCSIIFLNGDDCYRICEELQASPKPNSAVQYAAIKRDFSGFARPRLDKSAKPREVPVKRKSRALATPAQLSDCAQLRGRFLQGAGVPT